MHQSGLSVTQMIEDVFAELPFVNCLLLGWQASMCRRLDLTAQTVLYEISTELDDDIIFCRTTFY